VRCCLCDPTLSRFSRTPTCDGQTDGQTQGHGYRGCIASRGKNYTHSVFNNVRYTVCLHVGLCIQPFCIQCIIATLHLPHHAEALTTRVNGGSSHLGPYRLFPRDAMLARVLVMALCLSVTSRSFIETADRIKLIFLRGCFFRPVLLCVVRKFGYLEK